MMQVNKVNVQIWTSLVLLAHLGCGVEAGNPGGKGGSTTPTGSINLFFAKEPNAAAESLSLNIAGVDLLEGSDDSVVASLQSVVNQVDLLGLTETVEDTVVAKSSEIPTGVYDRIVVRLGDDRPVRYRGRDGSEKPVRLDESQGKAFYISQSFEVAEGATTSVVLTLDPYSSLQADGDGTQGFIFKPKGDAKLRDRGVRYEGRSTTSGVEWVCAYAYAVAPPPVPGADRRKGFSKKGEKVRPGPELAGRSTYGTKDAIVKDTNVSCGNAFTKAPVKDGNYELRHLVPASYSLRFFKVDGSYEDAAEDLNLGPKG
jgi:hypothetical protein